MNLNLPQTMLDGTLDAQVAWWLAGCLAGVGAGAIGSLIRLLKSLKNTSPDI
jgi:hypothetical protein